LFYFNNQTKATQNTFFNKERKLSNPAASEGHFLGLRD